MGWNNWGHKSFPPWLGGSPNCVSLRSRRHIRQKGTSLTTCLLPVRALRSSASRCSIVHWTMTIITRILPHVFNRHEMSCTLNAHLIWICPLAFQALEKPSVLGCCCKRFLASEYLLARLAVPSSCVDARSWVLNQEPKIARQSVFLQCIQK